MFLYPTVCALQIVGAVLGSLLEVALVPGLRWAWFGHHNKHTAPGCFYPGSAGVNSWELLLWELVLTFVLVRIIALHSLMAALKKSDQLRSWTCASPTLHSVQA